MNQAMINKIKKMQREIEEAQENINKTEFSSAYQGVTVFMLGTREVTRISLDQNLLEDKDMLEELLQVAINSCQKKVEKAVEEAMSPYAGLMGGLGF